MSDIKELTLTCRRCGNEWQRRTKLPKQCPGCRSPYWNKDRVRSVPRATPGNGERFLGEVEAPKKIGENIPAPALLPDAEFLPGPETPFSYGFPEDEPPLGTHVVPPEPAEKPAVQIGVDGPGVTLQELRQMVATIKEEPRSGSSEPESVPEPPVVTKVCVACDGPLVEGHGKLAGKFACPDEACGLHGQIQRGK